jgi:hypothetical protein
MSPKIAFRGKVPNTSSVRLPLSAFEHPTSKRPTWPKVGHNQPPSDNTTPVSDKTPGVTDKTGQFKIAPHSGFPEVSRESPAEFCPPASRSPEEMAES